MADYAVSITEGLTLDDSPSEAAEFAESITEGVTLDDSPSEAAEFAESVTEGLTLDDSESGYLQLEPNEAAGRFRIADNTFARYELYRGIDAEPDFSSSPWATFTSLPHTTADMLMGKVDLTSKCTLQLEMDDDDAQSQVDDTSGSGNHGTLFGPGPPIATSTRHTDGKLDGAFVYDQDTYVDLNSMVNLSAPYEILVWVYCDDNTARPNTIVTDGSYQKNCILVQKTGGSYNITFWNGEATPASVTWSAVGDLYQGWHLLRFAATSSTSITLFVDAVSKGAKTINTTTRFVDIGMSSGPPGYEWKGKIDLLEVFDEILSDAEATFLWSGGDGTEELIEYAGEYFFTLRKRNKYNLASQNIESWRVELDSDGDEIEPSPAAPQNISITPAAGGKGFVTAQYLYDLDDDYAATAWLIYFTDDGGDPDPASDSPTVVAMTKSRGMAYLEWTSAAADDEDTLKVMVRARRVDGGDNYDSDNTDIYSTTASTQGPAKPQARAFTGGAAQTM